MSVKDEEGFTIKNGCVLQDGLGSIDTDEVLRPFCWLVQAAFTNKNNFPHCRLEFASYLVS